MGLVDQAKKDSETYNSDKNDWAVDQIWTSPAALIVTIQGRHTKHHLGYDENGRTINTKTASCSFSEKMMIDNSYPIRDGNGEINLAGHRVDIKDSSGVLYNYIVEEFYPDEVLGLIVCILSAYGS